MVWPLCWSKQGDCRCACDTLPFALRGQQVQPRMALCWPSDVRQWAPEDPQLENHGPVRLVLGGSLRE
eukprot:12906850-Prorocentrum_lima.AAC.1